MTPALNNPFELAALASGGEIFGRQEELDWLMKGIHDQANSLLVGPQGVGKSSLLREVGSMLAERMVGKLIHLDLSRYADLSEVTTALKESLTALQETLPKRSGGKAEQGTTLGRAPLHSPERIPKSIHSRPTSSLEQKGGGPSPATATSTSHPSRSGGSPVEDFLKAMMNLNNAAEEQKSIVVLALDAFHEIMRLGGEGLARGMIDAMQKHSGLRHILAGDEQGMKTLPVDLLQERHAGLQTRKLEPLEPRAFAQWIDQRFASANIATQGVGAACVELAGAHPAQTIELAQHTFVLSVSARFADGSTVQMALKETVVKKSEHLAETWKGLSKNERQVLSAVAHGHGSQLLDGTEFKRAGLHSAEQVQSAIHSLVEKNLLDRSGSTELRVTSAAMRRWTMDTQKHSVELSQRTFVSAQTTRFAFNLHDSKPAARAKSQTI